MTTPIREIRRALGALGALARRGLPLLVVPFVALACDDPLPTGSDHDHTDATEDLEVALTFEPDHVHIHSEVAISAVVTDHHGETITDFEAIHLEYREVGATSWSEVELSLEGDAYVGTHTFANSGDYEVRVTGRRPGDGDMVVMHEMSEPLHAVPAHAEAGGYRVEFESFPGHVHEGDEATLRFWILEQEEDASGERAPVTGLTPEVHVTEGDATEATVSAPEADPGVYEADHTFGAAGEATIGLHFTGSDTSSAEAEFTLEVVHAH